MSNNDDFNKYSINGVRQLLDIDEIIRLIYKYQEIHNITGMCLFNSIILMKFLTENKMIMEKEFNTTFDYTMNVIPVLLCEVNRDTKKLNIRPHIVLYVNDYVFDPSYETYIQTINNKNNYYNYYKNFNELNEFLTHRKINIINPNHKKILIADMLKYTKITNEFNINVKIKNGFYLDEECSKYYTEILKFIDAIGYRL